MRRRILITAGSSYLGQHLVPLAMKDSAHEIGYTYYRHDPLGTPQGRYLNIRSQADVDRLIREFTPQVIIHTAGSNRGPNMAAVIQQGAEHITLAAARLGARLIHISTDVIFDGRQPPYDESASPSPVNEYGRAKAAAESIVSQYDQHVIVRTSLIYGLQSMDHGSRWMVDALQAAQPVKLFDNQFRNPVWVQTLCQACLELATSDFTGILNVAGRQLLSRAEFALKMLNWWGVTERTQLTVGPSEGNAWPLNCELDLSRAASMLSMPLLGVDEVLTHHAGQHRSLSNLAQ